ncbi:hypothetical protein KHS38_09035 [Mucilaginibacter sp. Bleaf8]|uniref:hypothetical protein n=1 Tax=Mucilaginibacter sp. Bleaf8 TaxID=2834430 RepID=UPI001BD00A38|nr:hypothetical protein [Mucilaginibacter sp. Bleaf8]MBS7564548.1 hypothetical protein [Mucilaginibacter sp. Bleaf8]
MIRNNPTVLAQFLAARSQFYNELQTIEDSYLLKLTEDQPAKSAVNLIESVQCHLDLSTLQPKLYVSRTLNEYLVEACVNALDKVFSENVFKQAAQSLLIWTT